MLDMYDFDNNIWLCHSYGGQCYNYTAFVSVKEFVRFYFPNNYFDMATSYRINLCSERNQSVFLLSPYFTCPLPVILFDQLYSSNN